MKTIRRPAFLLSLAAAGGLLLGAVASGLASESKLSYYRRTIQTNLDPFAAETFLVSDADQAQVRAEDEAAFLAIFRRAAELKDLRDMLLSFRAEDALRRGLLSRPGSDLFTKPAVLVAWSGRHMATAVDMEVLKEAVWDWGKLGEGQKTYLAGLKIDEAGWARLDLPTRHARVRSWGLAIRDRVMKASPKTREELEALRGQALDASGVLTHDESFDLWQHYRKAETAVEALAQAREKVSRIDNPELKGMLENAGKSGNLDATLGQLNKLFDKMAVDNAKLRSVAPPAADQAFTAADRQLMASMLKTALMKELPGTTAGNKLVEFYRAHDLRVAVSELGVAIAQYDPKDKTVTFNSKFVEEWVKGEGLTARGLLGPDGAAAFKRLTQQVSSTFVHEAIHQTQHAWADSQGFTVEYGQNMELETMQLEALFVLEKLRADPSYAATLKAAQGRSVLAREALGLADSLSKSQRGFHNKIVASHYPELVSLEGNTCGTIDFHKGIIEGVQAELKRREGLNFVSRALLDRGPDFPKRSMTVPELQRAYPTVGTPHLRALLKSQKALALQAAAIYAKNRDRLKGVDAEVAQGLRDLEAGKKPPSGAPKVPPPK